MLIEVVVEEVEDGQCQAAEGMMMTFDTLALVHRMHRRFMNLLRDVTLIVTALLLLLSNHTVVSCLRAVVPMLALYAVFALFGLRAYHPSGHDHPIQGAC